MLQPEDSVWSGLDPREFSPDIGGRAVGQDDEQLLPVVRPA